LSSIAGVFLKVHDRQGALLEEKKKYRSYDVDDSCIEVDFTRLQEVTDRDVLDLTMELRDLFHPCLLF